MNWDEVEQRLRAGFERLSQHVLAELPSVLGGRVLRINVSAQPFALVMSFSWAGQREFDDLLLSVNCFPLEANGPRRDDAPSTAQAYLRFEIERGTGETLRARGPRWLTHDPTDQRYWTVVNEFVEEVLQELEDAPAFVVRELEASR